MYLLAFRCMQQKEINLKISLLCPSVITSVSNHSPSFTYEEIDMWRGKFSHYQMISKSGWSYWFAIALTLMCQDFSSEGRAVGSGLRVSPAPHSFHPGLISNLFISGPVCPHLWQFLLGSELFQLFLKEFCAQLSSVSFSLLRGLLTLLSGFSISLYADRGQI